MTDILNMQAGEEMDALVAEKVMKWHIASDRNVPEHWEDEDGRWGAGIGKYPEDDAEFLHTLDFHPSESILWAWEVVEKMESEYRMPAAIIRSAILDGWSAEFLTENAGLDIVSVEADTPELAICRAALLAVENND